MKQIYGNTGGLSPFALKLLQRIYRRKVGLASLATPELMRSLAEASKECGRQVGALVHRSGQIDYVVVGDTGKLMLPNVGRLRGAEGRLRGLRLIHTHLFGEDLTKDDYVDLVRLRLDAIAALQLTPAGDIRGVVYAYNVPAKEEQRPYAHVGPVHPSQLQLHLGNLLDNLEAEFARRARSQKVRAKDGRAILVHIGTKQRRRALLRAEESMRELRELARTAGVEVVDELIQIRDKIDPRWVMGRGKVEDLLIRAAEMDAETLIFDRNLSPSQAGALSRHTELKILDRSQLILDIFAQRAESRDGKLQVELAQLKYSLPRLAQKDDSLSRLTGGIGGRGPGETRLEVGRRRAREKVSRLEKQLRTLAKQRKERRRRRHRQGVPVVAIVGYTNAGKSTLLNTLTGAEVLAEDKLFATLDTRSRRLRFPEEREVVLTDTVGFIRELPKDLFAAFRATFEEAADADLILHVLDASDPAYPDHKETTEQLLSRLELDSIPRLVVFNKLDLVENDEADRIQRAFSDSFLLTALRKESARPVLAAIASSLKERWAASQLGPSSMDVQAEMESLVSSEEAPGLQAGDGDAEAEDTPAEETSG